VGLAEQKQYEVQITLVFVDAPFSKARLPVIRPRDDAGDPGVLGRRLWLTLRAAAKSDINRPPLRLSFSLRLSSTSAWYVRIVASLSSSKNTTRRPNERTSDFSSDTSGSGVCAPLEADFDLQT